MKNRSFFLGLLAVMLSATSQAQISPPGLGVAHTASWFALGIRQTVGKAQKWESMSYIGLGRKSNPDNEAFLYKPSILVLNQEFYHHFKPKWQYALALSFRSQDEYQETAPYTHAAAAVRREFRLYGRMIHTKNIGPVKLTGTIRQELRSFKDRYIKNLTDELQLRTRLKLQFAFPLDARKKNRLMAGAESLFSSSKKADKGGWTDFGYQESRFTFYYTIAPDVLPGAINLGYMYNLVGANRPFGVHYIAMDIVLESPFGSKAR